MGQFPLRKDEILTVPYLVPNGTVCFIPDTLFDWVWSNEEIEALGRKLGPDYYVVRNALRFRSLLESSDEEPEPGQENDSSHYAHIPKHVPYSPPNKLLDGALNELGQLAEKYRPQRHFFTIYKDFPQIAVTQFVSIYTNRDLARARGSASIRLPSVGQRDLEGAALVGTC